MMLKDFDKRKFEENETKTKFEQNQLEDSRAPGDGSFGGSANL